MNAEVSAAHAWCEKRARTFASPSTLRIHSSVFASFALRSVNTGTPPFAFRGTAYARRASA
jgi:hypothetical protein